MKNTNQKSRGPGLPLHAGMERKRGNPGPDHGLRSHYPQMILTGKLDGMENVGSGKTGGKTGIMDVRRGALIVIVVKVTNQERRDGMAWDEGTGQHGTIMMIRKTMTYRRIQGTAQGQGIGVMVTGTIVGVLNGTGIGIGGWNRILNGCLSQIQMRSSRHIPLKISSSGRRA